MESQVSQLSDLRQRAAAYAEAARSPRTRRGYAADMADFSRWCAAQGLAPLPAAPATVGLYLADRAGTLATATLQRRLAAIRAAHRDGGWSLDLSDPALRSVWQGIRRVHGTRRQGKAPVMPADLKQMVNLESSSRKGLRNRSLLLLGICSSHPRLARM